MTMHCYQCEETDKGEACTIKGVCGKSVSTAKLQDQIIEATSRLAFATLEIGPKQTVDDLIRSALFATITNVNFDNTALRVLLNKLMAEIERYTPDAIPTVIRTDIIKSAGVLTMHNPDRRSAKELLIYGVKGIAAYAEHAAQLGYRDEAVDHYVRHVMAALTTPLKFDHLIEWILKAGEIAVATMALLDKAHTETYGAPEISTVELGTGSKPGILISGHDLQDLAQLLAQSEHAGVDIYTHGEMLPAHYYPYFKKYDHLKGNYGGAWWQQEQDFTAFNGPILMTTNCLTPPQDDYEERLFTTGLVGFSGLPHISEANDGTKDFSGLIELAKNCPPPTQLESGQIVGGFGHSQVIALADQVVEAVKSGAIKRFVVMAGCDGRSEERDYYTKVAEQLPDDAVILTAGCAKYRYNKLDLGDINGIPRVLDAGQCNDCYSLAVIALKLQQAFEVESLNDLPISFDVAWYEQKAVAVLLALLHLGVKGIRLGPNLPAFVTGKVADILVNQFAMKGIATPEQDVADMMAGN
ncbi:hydroxylamine reductase [Neiella marina]|uniref:Hydroxylamine reductase n=1 Tax=Neiella holothuriorum TaxID=2870530 RepID=A0ABS7EKP3_9GAMM|nr:hydroxylamine reductase [Neiella holothuriorum]MBW8192880.1 hydroxylamine reductase [Neiella holothuriorum]